MKSVLIFAFAVFFLFQHAFAQQSIDQMSANEIRLPEETAGQVLVLDGDKKIISSPSIDNTELETLDGVTSNIQSQIDSKEASLPSGTSADYLRGDKTMQPLDKAAVGLGNVDNTSDASKNAASVTITNHTIDADNNTIQDIDNNDIKASAAIDASKIADGSVSTTEFQYINTLSSNAQTQISGKVEGVASSVDSEVMLYSGTGGKTSKRATGTGFAKLTSGVLSTSSTVNAASELTGLVPLANGGCNKNITPAAGGVIWTDSDSCEVISAGTSGQLLQSNGSSAPSWVTGSNSSDALTAPGLVHPKKFFGQFGGNGGSQSSPTVCSGTCGEYYDSHSAFSVPTRNSTGNYAFVVANGTCKNSSFIDCNCKSSNNGQYGCNIGGLSFVTNGSGGYSETVRTYTGAGTAQDTWFAINCTCEPP